MVMKRRSMERIGIATFLVVLSLSLLGSPVFGQQTQSTIGGMVTDPNRRPVVDVRVELMNDTYSVLQRAKTDGAGRFIFRSLYSGRFIIKVLPLGTNFEEQTSDVEITGMGRGGQIADNVQVDFQLRVRKNNASQLAANGVVFAQEIPPDAQKTYTAAVADLDANKTEAGVAGLETAIKIFPTYFQALSRVGLAYISQQKFDLAKDAFTKAVAVNDRSFISWYGLTYANYAMNQPAATIPAAQKALELDKTSVDALFLLGLAQRKVKDYAAAEKSLVQAKKFDNGKTPDISWNLALLYAHNLKQYKNAANELEMYLTLIPADVPNRESIKKLIKQFRDNPPASE